MSILNTLKLGVGVAVLGVIGLLAWRAEHFARRAAENAALLETLSAINARNAEANAQITRQIARVRVIFIETAQRAQAVDARYEQDRRRIENALPEDDGPLAPVLRGWLDGLPEPPAGGENRIYAGSSAGVDRAVIGANP